jgi:hypothetical protein
MRRKWGTRLLVGLVIGKGWLRGVDLNHRPLGYEPNELPGCSTPQIKNISGVTGGQMRAQAEPLDRKFQAENRSRVLSQRYRSTCTRIVTELSPFAALVATTW